jgi:hypothetical protein
MTGAAAISTRKNQIEIIAQHTTRCEALEPLIRCNIFPMANSGRWE